MPGQMLLSPDGCKLEFDLVSWFFFAFIPWTECLALLFRLFRTFLAGGAKTKSKEAWV